MKILLDDGFAIAKGGGIGVYTELLHLGLKEFGAEAELAARGAGLLKYLPNAFNRAWYTVYLNTLFQLKQRKYDIVHFTNYMAPALNFSQTKYVVTIHDLAPLKIPDTIPAGNRAYAARTINNAVAKGAFITVPTESIRRELEECFPDQIESFRLKVIPNAVPRDCRKLAPAEIRFDEKAVETAARMGQFILYAGTVEKRKNVVYLIEALKRIRADARFGNLRLIIAGRLYHGSRDVVEAIRSAGLGDAVQLLGYVTRNDLICLYNMASCLVCASIYEGFSRPPVEAGACGLPSAISAIPVHREVMAEGAIYFPLDNPDIAAHTIKRLLTDLNVRGEIITAAQRRAERFTIENATAEAITFYRSIV